MSSITINGDTSGSVILQANATAGSTTLILPTSNGTVVTSNTIGGLSYTGGGAVNLPTSGTVTIPNGTGTAAVQGVSTNIVSGTSQASTSGTSIDFTGIPSWVKRITVMLNGVSTNGTSIPILQLGNGSVTTSGYLSNGTGMGSGVGTTQYTTGFAWTNGMVASDTHYGNLVIDLLGSNIWIFNGSVYRNSGNNGIGTGSITLGGTLDRVRITTVNGTDTFDAGSINILYE